MKIAWVSHSSSLGGSELTLWDAARGLVAKGHQVHVILPGQGVLADRLASAKISSSIVPSVIWVHRGVLKHPIYYQFRRLLINLSSIRMLSKQFKQLQPDIVVTNTLAMPVGAFAAKWVGIPHVWCINEFLQEDHGGVYDYGETLSLFWVNRLSDLIIVTSRAVWSKFIKFIPERKLRLVYPPADVPSEIKYDNKSGKTLSLILVGQIAPGKRQEDAIRALALLVRQGLDVNLTLVGDARSEYSAFLHQLAKESEVDELVQFVDFTTDPFSYIASADVALMCSRSEALGKVTIEAMKLGKPVIGAASGGTMELVQTGVNGLLYKPCDAEDLARQIKVLYDDRVLLERLGNNARDWSIKTFSTEKYVSSLLDVFEEVLTPKNKCASASAIS